MGVTASRDELDQLDLSRLAIDTDAPLLNRLQAAGAALGSDKIIFHGYQYSYAECLLSLQDNSHPTILEIGFGKGDGLRLWRSVFPTAHLICLDIDHQIQGDDFEVIKVDQTDHERVQEILTQRSKKFDLIIDDGSHHPSHQISSFNQLFPWLKENALYIIEDIETSYWRRGSLYGYPLSYGLRDPWSTVEIFKQVADLVNHRCLSEQDQSFVAYQLSALGLDVDNLATVHGLHFYPNLIAVRRLHSELQAKIKAGSGHPNLVARL